jgi:hypothetical protein
MEERMKSIEEKRQEAQARQELRNERTPAQQLALLDERFGPGKGAKRERTRLEAIINSANNGGVHHD